MREFTAAFLQVLISLGVGGVASMGLVPWSAMARGFFRSTAAVYAAVQAFVLYWLVQPWLRGAPDFLASWPGIETLLLLASFGGAVGYAVAVWTTSDRFRRGAWIVASATGGLGLLIEVLRPRGMPLGAWELVGLGFNALLSSFLVGTVMTAMLFGHYYLNEPRMDVRPIRRIAAIFLVATLAQGLLPLANAGALYGIGAPAAAERVGAAFSAWGGLVLMRYLFGIVATLIVAGVIWNTLGIPNVQSATGFFYIAILTILVGEFLGRVLVLRTHLPF
jgi:hypothetical protein